MGKDAPEPPDPYATAAAQAQANKESVIASSILNAVNQYSPYGSTTYTYRQGGEFAGAPESQTITFAPEVQAAYDAQVATAGNVADYAQRLSGQLPASAFSLGDVPSGLDVAGAIYDQGVRRLEPQLDRERDLLSIGLSERGIPLGSEISNLERDRFERNVLDAYGNLSNQATLAAQAEQQRQIQNALVERTQGINEIAAALQGAPALQTPSFMAQPAYGVGAPDVAGLVQNAYAAEAANHQNSEAAKASLLGSIGQAALLA